MEQSFISKICRVSLATSGISFCQLAEIQMSLGFFFPVLAIPGRNGSPAPWLFMEQIIAPG